MAKRRTHVACVLGGMDIVRPLALAGVRSWVMARAGQPMRYSRFVDGVIEYVDPWNAAEKFVDRLLSFARQRRAPPILYYENDGYLAAISDYRHELADAFRFVLPAKELVDDLVDKRRFDQLARRLHLPTPPSWTIASSADLHRLRPPPPIVVKPLTRYDRDNWWINVGGSAKAICLSSSGEMEQLSDRLDATPLSLLAQQLIPGPESRVESYHVYARQPGEVTAYFMGRKVRTWPIEYGHSTALTTTEAADVEELGRTVVHALQLSGVAKLDFKRDAEGRLHLLEVNPRFTLWNHLGAVAGVNIPALVYDDLTDRLEDRPVTRAKAGVTWCDIPRDFRAARSQSIGIMDWLSSIASSNIRTDLAWNDPMPFLRGRLLAGAIRRLPRFKHRSTTTP